jgi:hypothetical protein
MKKFSRFLLSTLALAFVLSLGTAAHATTYVVGPCSSDPALQGPDGIQIVLGDYAPTPLVAGDTIEACPGTIFFGDNVVYTDNITITKVPKMSKPFVSCAQEPDPTTGGDIGFLVLSQGVTIKDMDISSCDVAILDPGPGFEGPALGGISNALQTVKSPYNMVLASGGTGLTPLGTLNANVSPTWKSATGKGKHKNSGCPKSDVNLCVTGNVIEDNGLGVLTFGVGDADIDSNQFTANYYAAVLLFDSFTSKIDNNKITGFQDVTPDCFEASGGILDADGDQDEISGNTVEDTGIAIGLEAFLLGTQKTTVKGNTTKYNAVGLEVDTVDYWFDYLPQQSSQNVFSNNNSRNNLTPSDTAPEFYTADCIDFTGLGSGTAGTLDTWKTSNHCGTSLDISGAPLP